MIEKVIYEEMEPLERLDFLKVTIQECEESLRGRTDRALQGQAAFDLILEN